MIQFRSVFWFLIRNFRNNIVFFTGNLLIFSLQYMILVSQFSAIFTYDHTWFPIFIVICFIGMIYNFIFYFNQSGRIGLLLLYGITRMELFFIVFIENLFIMVFSLLLNLFLFAAFDFYSFFILIFLIALISLVSSFKYFFSDIYKIVRE